ncbi:hypothetical protein [Nitrosomonas communis]|uniref:hypothetical protein n=1 Tax=Nitrosomonas communis TaxID=44574 RepID=UPI003D277400
MKRSIVMARIAYGKEVLEQAKDLLVNSRTVKIKTGASCKATFGVLLINEADSYSNRCFSRLGVPTSNTSHPQWRQA